MLQMCIQISKDLLYVIVTVFLHLFFLSSNLLLTHYIPLLSTPLILA